MMFKIKIFISKRYIFIQHTYLIIKKTKFNELLFALEMKKVNKKEIKIFIINFLKY